MLVPRGRELLDFATKVGHGIEGATADRFQAKGLRALRASLGLSSEAFAKLVGVSAQSIYNWEHGKATPRPIQLAALAAVRKMGKRDALAAVAKRK